MKHLSTRLNSIALKLEKSYIKEAQSLRVIAKAVNINIGKKEEEKGKKNINESKLQDIFLNLDEGYRHLIHNQKDFEYFGDDELSSLKTVFDNLMQAIKVRKTKASENCTDPVKAIKDRYNFFGDIEIQYNKFKRFVDKLPDEQKGMYDQIKKRFDILIDVIQSLIDGVSNDITGQDLTEK